MVALCKKWLLDRPHSDMIVPVFVPALTLEAPIGFCFLPARDMLAHVRAETFRGFLRSKCRSLLGTMQPMRGAGGAY